MHEPLSSHQFIFDYTEKEINVEKPVNEDTYNQNRPVYEVELESMPMQFEPISRIASLIYDSIRSPFKGWRKTRVIPTKDATQPSISNVS